jgi:hypothetical protein
VRNKLVQKYRVAARNLGNRKVQVVRVLELLEALFGVLVVCHLLRSLKIIR